MVRSPLSVRCGAIKMTAIIIFIIVVIVVGSSSNSSSSSSSSSSSTSSSSSSSSISVKDSLLLLLLLFWGDSLDLLHENIYSDLYRGHLGGAQSLRRVYPDLRRDNTRASPKSRPERKIDHFQMQLGTPPHRQRVRSLPCQLSLLS